MITLITGVPGSGKTALAVAMLSEVQGRPVFVQGIPELKIAHLPCPPVAEWTVREASPDDPDLVIPKFTFPPGSLIVIDEAQNVYRPRGSSAKVPDHVAAFEAHRHLGIDFWLITQSPGLIDANIRKLISKHVHVRGSYLSRVIHEAPACFDPDSRSERALTATRKYTLPKKAFALYKSAELHTKVKTRLPRAVYILGVALLIGAGLAWRAADRVSDFVDPSEAEQAATAQPGTVAVAPGVPVVAASVGVPKSLMEALTPADPHNPLSAPLYAGVAPAPVAPEVQGCISSKSSCTCYSQQQTPVWMPDEQCRQRAAGRYYDPYRRSRSAPADKQEPMQAEAQPSPAGLGRGFDGVNESDAVANPAGAAPPSGAGYIG